MKSIAPESVSSYFAVREGRTETCVREADKRQTFSPGAECCLQTTLSMKEEIDWELKARASS